MAFQEQIIFQARENSTNAVSVYSPGASTTAVIKTIFICNQSGASATFRLFVDDDGTTYDETTALYWDVSVPGNYTLHLNTFIAMDDQTGNIAYRSSVANALTVTGFGALIT